MSNSRIRPSPARSQGQGDPASPRRVSLRKTRSVSSPARSTASGRLTSVIRLQDMDSFRLSPMPTRRSVLNDDTDVAEETRRRSWWKKLSNNSRDMMMEVLNDNKVLETNEAIEEYIDVDVLSQEKKNYTMDIPESSDSESISSIVIPQRKLFTEKENKPQKKFSQIGTRRSSVKLHKTTDNDKTVTVAPKNLFNHPSRAKSKPVFPAGLLTISPEKIVNKTKEIAAGEVKVQVRPLFGNRASTKRKSMFIDFIVSESEDEISEIQPRVFGFQKKGEQQPESSNVQRRDPSPTSSINTDVEMDEWKHLPSSTMVENQFEDMIADKTPVKKAKLSKLSTNNTSINKTKQSVKDKSLNSSKVLTHNQSQNHEVQQKQTKRYGQNSLTEDASINVNIENQKQVVEEILDEFDKDVEMDKDENAINENYLDTDTEKNNIITNNQSLTMQNKNSSISSTKPNNKSINSKNLTENYDPVKANASLNKSTPSPDIEPNTSQTKNDTNANTNVTKNVDKSKTNIKSANSITLKDDNQSLKAFTQQNSISDKEIADKQSLKEASLISQKHSRVVSESETKGQNQEESEVEEENEIELSLHYESDEDNENQDNATLAKSVLNDVETSVEKENDSQDETHNNSEEVNHYKTSVEKENDSQDETHNNSEEVNHYNKTQEEVQDESYIKNSETQNEKEEQINAVVEEVENENNDQDSKVPNECQDKIKKGEEELSEQSIKNIRNASEVEELEEPDEQSQEKHEKSQIQEQSVEEQEQSIEKQEQTEEEQKQSVEAQEQTEEEQKQSVEAQEQTEEEQEQTEEEQEHSVEAQEQSEEEQEQTEEEQEQTEEDQEQSVEAQEQSAEEQEQSEEEQEQTKEEQEQSVEELEQTKEEQELSVDAQEQTREEQKQSVEAQERTEEEQEQSEEEHEQSDEEQVQSEEEQEQSEEEQVQSEEEQVQSEEEQEEHELEESQEIEPFESSAEIEDSNENNAQNDEDVDMENDEENELENSETPNASHDTTGRHRKKEHSKVKSPEAVLHDKTKQMESFMAKGRNTSLRRTSIMKSMNIRTSLAPPRESTGLSDGTNNSSAEGSGWDSHRTTRKTLRQTFGKDFSPRKSLRALVMEKSAKRQTAMTDITSVTSKFPQANSTELPEASNFDENDYPGEANHDVSKRTRQTTLEMYLQKIKKQNMEKKMKMEEAVRNSLKAPPKDITNIFKVPTRPPFAARKSSTKQAQNKPKARQIKSNLLCFDDLPDEVKEDMKYKPPKRFQPNDAAWITKRLYKSLETKLEPKYDYKARVRAEKLVQSIYQFCRELKRREVAPPDAVELLKHEMARLDIVKTHFEFYQFFREYMPREVRIKVIPDIVNKIPMPRQGIFSDILRANTIHE